MTLDEFWKYIEDAGDGSDPDGQAKRIEAALAKRSLKEIVAFEHHMSELLGSSYTWELWGAAYLINGGCSDDAFDYFRGWLMAQGRAIFERAVADPDSLADLDDLDDTECEEIAYAADRAYESVTGTEMPREMPEGAFDLSELGENWDFDDDDEMKVRYPKLFAKFC